MTVRVPSWRATKDIGIAADLVEEVGRVFGYDHIPPVAPTVVVARPDRNAKKKFEAKVRDELALATGLDEVQTYSFDDDAFLQRAGLATGDRVRMVNAISSEMPCLRAELAPHLVMVLEKNARTFAEVGVFEVGRVFVPVAGALPEQPTWLGALIASTGEAPADAVWFRRGKAVLSALARAVERAEPVLVAGGVAAAWAHPVRQARLLLDGAPVGVLAELSPRLLHRLGVAHHGVVLELDLDRWRASEERPVRYRPLAKFPSVFRDFAVVVGREVPAETLRQAILGADERVAEVAFQSVYTGPGVAEGDKSLAWSVTLRDPARTLAEGDVREAEGAIWAAVAALGGRGRA